MVLPVRQVSEGQDWVEVGVAMKVTEAIIRLQALADAGYGDSVIRIYSELADEIYPPIQTFAVRKPQYPDDGEDGYFNEAWVEVR